MEAEENQIQETEIEEEEETHEITPPSPINDIPPKQNTQSPRSILKKSIGNRSVKGKNVYLMKNMYPRTNKPRIYRLQNFDDMLQDSIDILMLPYLPKKVFSEEGSLITSIDEIKDKQTLYFSCGEKFGQGLISPKKKLVPPPPALPTPIIDIDQSTKSPKKTQSPHQVSSPHQMSSPHQVSSPNQESSPNQVFSPKQPQAKLTKREIEINSFQRIAALASFSADECLKDAASSVFANLTEVQKKRIQNHEYLQALHDETQQSHFIVHLFEKSICPTGSDSLLNDRLNEWAMDILNGIEINEIKFVIAGPRHSGKSTFLYYLANQISRKLQLCDEAQQFMFFPMNFEYVTIEFDNAKNLLRVFVTNIFESIKYSNFKLLPYISAMKQWFTSVINGNVPQFPSSLNNIEYINTKKLNEIGRTCLNLLNEKDTESLTHFVKKLVKLPAEFADALGFKAPLYIFDSFEFADSLIQPSSSMFPDSLKAVSLANILSTELNGRHYIVSMQDEQRFFECFACEDSALLDMENSIKNLPNNYLPNISIFHPNIHFTLGDCNGCPGVISHYAKLVESIRRYGYNSVRQILCSPIQSTVDFSRMYGIKQDLKNLCYDMLSLGNPQITKDLLASLDDTFISIKDFLLISDGEEEEEEADDAKANEQVQN